MAAKKVAPAGADALESAPAEVQDAIEAAKSPVAALQELARQAAERTVAESGATYARVKAAADDAANALETSVTAVSKGVVDFNAKALDAFRANFDAGIDFAKAALNIKTFSDLVTLQSAHVTKQAETFAAQAKEFGALAQKIATETAEPIKTQVAKTFKLPA